MSKQYIFLISDLACGSLRGAGFAIVCAGVLSPLIVKRFNFLLADPACGSLMHGGVAVTQGGARVPAIFGESHSGLRCEMAVVLLEG